MRICRISIQQAKRAGQPGCHCHPNGKAIEHRGPDDSGAWADAQAGIALGFRRLAVIDLSPAGHQPMVLSVGRPPVDSGWWDA